MHQLGTFLAGAALLMACQQSPSNGQETTTMANTPPATAPDPNADGDPDAATSNGFLYNLSQPSEKVLLPVALNEISGLCYYEGEKVLAVQDEIGHFFVVNSRTGEIEQREKYTDPGDFEGIALVNKHLYTLRADGKIFRTKRFTEEDRETKKYKTDLDEKNDAEGLCYDAANNRLLVACKGHPGKKDSKGKKAIYGFDLEEKTLSDDPVFWIDRKKIGAFIGADKPDFSPSGIAIHPQSGDVYIIATVGKLLVVLDPQGAIKHVEQLDPKVFKQPEGICFLPNGDLLISNEARYKTTNANLLRFSILNP